MSIGLGLRPGDRIRLYRRRAGLTQQQCAHFKGCTVSAWRKWESGERRVAALADWIEIARILRVRDLYQLTGLPEAKVPEGPAEHEAVPAIRAAMVAFPPSLPGDPDIARLDRAVDRAWTAWQEHRSFDEIGTLLPGLIGELRATIPVVDGRDREAILRSAAMLYFLTRAFTKRVGAQDVSLLASDRALAAAVKADDPGYRAAAAWNIGMTLYPQGHAKVVADLARDAAAELAPVLAHAPPAWASAFGALQLLLAVQLVRLGDVYGALSALDTAESVAERIGDRVDFRIIFGPTNVGIHRAWLALEISGPAEAIRLAHCYDISAAPCPERRSFHYVTLARAYSVRNEDVAALHMLLRAEKESALDTRYNPDARGVAQELLRRDNPAIRGELWPLADRIGVLR